MSKKVRFNGYETDAPMAVEAVYNNVHMKVPDTFVEHIAGATAHLNEALNVHCGDTKMRDAAYAFNRVTSILRSIDNMMSELREYRS